MVLCGREMSKCLTSLHNIDTWSIVAGSTWEKGNGKRKENNCRGTDKRERKQVKDKDNGEIVPKHQAQMLLIPDDIVLYGKDQVAQGGIHGVIIKVFLRAEKQKLL